MTKIQTYLLIPDIVSNLTSININSIDNIKNNYSQALLFNVYNHSICGSVNLNWVGKNNIENCKRKRIGEAEIKLNDFIILEKFASIDKNNDIDYQKIIYAKTTTNIDVTINSFLDEHKMYLTFEFDESK